MKPIPSQPHAQQLGGGVVETLMVVVGAGVVDGRVVVVGTGVVDRRVVVVGGKVVVVVIFTANTRVTYR